MKAWMKPDGGRGCTTWGIITRLLIAICLAGILFSCSQVTRYSVNLKYQPPESPPVDSEKIGQLVFTVAQFNDLRQVDEKKVIGAVVKSEGNEIPVFPKYRMPSEAVSDAVRNFMGGAGYRVSKEMPPWNLKDDEIRKEWGDVVIGGNIDEFKVTCLKKMPIREYMATVKLTVIFADVAEGKTKLTVTVESSPSLEHIRFSEEKIEEVITDALTAAINKIFENRKIQEMAAKEHR